MDGQVSLNISLTQVHSIASYVHNNELKKWLIFPQNLLLVIQGICLKSFKVYNAFNN